MYFARHAKKNMILSFKRMLKLEGE